MKVCAFARNVGMEVCSSHLILPTCTLYSALCATDVTDKPADIAGTYTSHKLGVIATVNELKAEGAPFQQVLLATFNLHVPYLLTQNLSIAWRLSQHCLLAPCAAGPQL